MRALPVRTRLQWLRCGSGPLESGLSFSLLCCQIRAWCSGVGTEVIPRLKNARSLPDVAIRYEIFAAHWPYQKTDGNPIAAAINNAKKYVVSRTSFELGWNNSILIEGDVVDEIKKLKKQHGPELQVHGSGNLIQTLLKYDLIDEYWLKIFPITLGVGKRLFADGTTPVAFVLRESKTSSSGVIIAAYERAGEVKMGSFAMEKPT
jgi:dihydrofolate reductase